MQRYGGGVHDLDAIGRTNLRRHFCGLRFRREDTLDIVLDRLRIERRPVLKRHVVPQRERPRICLGRGRPARCERGMIAAVRTENQERVGDERVDEPCRLIGLDVAIERRGLSGAVPCHDEMRQRRGVGVGRGLTGRERKRSQRSRENTHRVDSDASARAWASWGRGRRPV